MASLQAQGSSNVPEITITTRQEDDYAQIVVEDNGPGMEEEVRKRIFEPFFTTKPIGFGTGLGLSVARTIVHAHGGQLRLVNRPDGGLRAVMRLPQ